MVTFNRVSVCHGAVVQVFKSMSKQEMVSDRFIMCEDNDKGINQSYRFFTRSSRDWEYIFEL